MLTAKLINVEETYAAAYAEVMCSDGRVISVCGLNLGNEPYTAKYDALYAMSKLLTRLNIELEALCCHV